MNKLPVIGDSMISNMLGSRFAYFYLRAAGTRDGILVAWHMDKWCCSHVHLSDHAVTINAKHCLAEDSWWLTVVYGPQDDQEKVAFLEELCRLRMGRLGPWLLCGDFNLIYKATNKNNDCLNCRLMVRVCWFLKDLEFIEMHL
jgi:hypothetical protein